MDLRAESLTCFSSMIVSFSICYMYNRVEITYSLKLDENPDGSMLYLFDVAVVHEASLIDYV